MWNNALTEKSRKNLRVFRPARIAHCQGKGWRSTWWLSAPSLSPEARASPNESKLSKFALLTVHNRFSLAKMPRIATRFPHLYDTAMKAFEPRVVATNVVSLVFWHPLRKVIVGWKWKERNIRDSVEKTATREPNDDSIRMLRGGEQSAWPTQWLSL
jgi:hypothetical protein